MSQKIIDILNSNPFKDIEVSSYDRFLIRLCALLHDVSNVPYGHTLEDEGKLLQSQWKDENRVKRFLDEGSDIAKALSEDEILKELARTTLDKKYDPKEVLKQIKEILISNELKTVESLKKPFIADIVGNTLCADLLDYIKRDVYFTGLREAYDERFLSYLYVTNYRGKPRLVLRLIKPRTGEVRRDVLSELLHLLRLRYSLAEKVYYHHSKIAASAMLISAISAMEQSKKLTIPDLYGMTDEGLLQSMEKDGDEIAKYLAGKLRRRQLYRMVYQLTYTEKALGRPESTRKEELIDELRNSLNRYNRERELESKNNLKPGRVVIYCPGPEMGQKAVETIVKWGSRETDIGPLEQIADERIRNEIGSSIVKKHLELWKMYVLVDPILTDVEQCQVGNDCKSIFGLPSAEEKHTSLTDEIPTYFLRLATKWDSEHAAEDSVTIKELNLIHKQSATWAEKKDWLNYDQFCKLMGDIRKKS
jgi:hypothetical protein